MPTDDPAEIEARAKAYLEELKIKLQAQHPDCDVTTTLRASVLPLKPDAASPATELALALTGANDTNQASFATEAGIFQNNGLPAVVCGPGDIAQAHTRDEYICTDQLQRGVEVYQALMQHAIG